MSPYKKLVIGLSGGMDSATLLGILLEQGAEVHCCIFYYGSKHNKYENKAAKDIIKFYQNQNMPVFDYKINISKVMELFKSNLLLSGGEIPEGHYAEDVMKQTVVPGRNLIFSSIMAGLAESIGAQAVGLGVHSGDHHIYPDCREDFIMSLDSTVLLSSDKAVKIHTPLLFDDKTSILKKGYKCDPPVPYHLTRTCYKDQVLSCGKCGACSERLEAFQNIGILDPIKYE